MKNITIKSLEAKLGTLSAPSKMPCFSFSIPAQRCIIGSKLREKATNSTCASCYALRGRYVFKNVREALENRFNKLMTSELSEWVSNMSLLIAKKEKSGFFRWHDSGDLQSVEHFAAIVQIAKELPQIKFWLPTREYKIVNDFVSEQGTLPSNLTVRLSAYFVGSKPPQAAAKRMGAVTSTVDFSESKHVCPSSKQGGKCLDCRACWDKNVSNVDYPKH
jgi:hypothetical protein